MEEGCLSIWEEISFPMKVLILGSGVVLFWRHLQNNLESDIILGREWSVAKWGEELPRELKARAYASGWGKY